MLVAMFYKINTQRQGWQEILNKSPCKPLLLTRFCTGMIYITHHSSLLYRFMQTVRYQFTLHPDPFVIVCFLCGPLPTQEQHSFFFIFRRAAHMLAYCQLFYSLLILFSFFFSYVLGSQQSWRCCIFPLSQSWLSSLPVLYSLFYYQLYWRLKTNDVGRPHF